MNWVSTKLKKSYQIKLKLPLPIQYLYIINKEYGRIPINFNNKIYREVSISSYLYKNSNNSKSIAKNLNEKISKYNSEHYVFAGISEYAKK